MAYRDLVTQQARKACSKRRVVSRFGVGRRRSKGSDQGGHNRCLAKNGPSHGQSHSPDEQVGAAKVDGRMLLQGASEHLSILTERFGYPKSGHEGGQWIIRRQVSSVEECAAPSSADAANPLAETFQARVDCIVLLLHLLRQ